ncbi:hypothetical protein TNCT_130781 [Trichonephila clavata]|uniref:Uncharacterized protein n=1 Tax=Trichonephila clavata TaxID=2740835 RepID=A0A8X6FYN4_TRICU|nr:hypothetical protein TNCT_130781 [Trichonephila clavata]
MFHIFSSKRIQLSKPSSGTFTSVLKEISHLVIYAPTSFRNEDGPSKIRDFKCRMTAQTRQRKHPRLAWVSCFETLTLANHHVTEMSLDNCDQLSKEKMLLSF